MSVGVTTDQKQKKQKNQKNKQKLLFQKVF